MYDYLICVATLNNPDRLRAFLNSIKKYTSDFNYKIAITDDCSMPEFTEKNYQLAVEHNCFYTRNQERSGVPYSWNRAAEQCDSKYIIISNDDILVRTGWLHAFDSFIKANDKLNLGVLAWPATNDMAQVKWDEKEFTVNVDESHLSTPIVACAGYLFGMIRSHYALVGRFDERYFATWEEIDFGAKLCMNGIKSVGLNAPYIYHEGGASFKDPINEHPAMIRQSEAQGQWIDKWINILNIKRGKKKDSTMIKVISDTLVAKIPKYNIKDFNQVKIKVP